MKIMYDQSRRHENSDDKYNNVWIGSGRQVLLTTKTEKIEQIRNMLNISSR